MQSINQKLLCLYIIYSDLFSNAYSYLKFNMYKLMHIRSSSKEEVVTASSLLLFIVYCIYNTITYWIDIYNNGYINAFLNNWYQNRIFILTSFIFYLGIYLYGSYGHYYERYKRNNEKNEFMKTSFHEVLEEIKRIYSYMINKNVNYMNVFLKTRQVIYIDNIVENLSSHEMCSKLISYNINRLDILNSNAEKIDFYDAKLENMFFYYDTKSKKYQIRSNHFTDIDGKDYPALNKVLLHHCSKLDERKKILLETCIPKDVIEHILLKY